MKLFQSSTIFKQRNDHEVSCELNFRVKFFAAPSSKYIFATLRTVASGKSELTFLLLLYFHTRTLLYQNLFYYILWIGEEKNPVFLLANAF